MFKVHHPKYKLYNTETSFIMVSDKRSDYCWYNSNVVLMQLEYHLFDLLSTCCESVVSLGLQGIHEKFKGRIILINPQKPQQFEKVEFEVKCPRCARFVHLRKTL